MQVGGLGILGLSLPRLLRAEEAQRQLHTPQSLLGTPTGGNAKACIVIWLAGGPSQPDMWDMKPDAPVEIRGECEHLPRIAMQVHNVTVIRSAHHQVGHAHCAAAYFVLSGDNRGDTFVNFGEDPVENPVPPHDVVATIYSLLGIPPETELPDRLGRPVRVGGPGTVIKALMT
jgi:hypothetical protein